MMYSLIDHYVEGLFENVPYSRASAQGRSRVQERLRAQYDTEKKASREGAFQRVVAACPTLASAAALAGYTGEEVAAWLSDQDIAGEDQVLRAFRFTRRRLYTVLILSALAVRFLLSGVTEGIWTYYVLSAVLLLFAALAFKKRGPAPDMRLSMEAVQCLQALGDKYVKKTFNTLFIAVVAAACFALTSVQLNGNSKDVEMLRYLAANSYFVLAFLALLIKNRSLSSWAHRLLDTPVSQTTSSPPSPGGTTS